MPGLLTGIRVIENASVISGPMAGSLLADLGADVLKIENPQGGDQFRKWDGAEERVPLSFAVYNRGKRSMTLDLRSASGQEIYRRLAAEADVLIENFRPGTMDRYGIGYENLSQVNPRLVYCEVTGVGATGPDADRPTFDAVAQALSGLWSGFVDLDRPEPVGPPMSDTLTGIYAALGIVSAIVSRGSSGSGTKISVNMLSSSIAFNGLAFASVLDGRPENQERLRSKSGRAQGSQSYAFLDCDGKPFAVHLSTPKKFWSGLCKVAGMPELIEDERYDTKIKRIRSYFEIRERFGAVFETKPRASWLDELSAADVPCAPILSVAEAAEQPQVKHLDMLWTEPGPGYTMVRSPISVGEGFAVADHAAPKLGADTQAVLADLGYSDVDIKDLQLTGVV